jgi:NADH-quinone oxidoreductase subunit J
VTHLLAAGGGTNLDADYSVAFFWILATLAGSAAVAMILVRQAVHCALLLAVVMLSLSALYAMQGAPFLAFVQVIVYTGAVLMLFLFVMMLIGGHSKDSLAETLRGQWLWGILAAGGLALLLIIGIGHAAIGSAPKPSSAFGTNNLTGLAQLIFTTYVYPFEITSALLITAALGAMVLAHRERTSPKPTQRDIARQRVRSGHVMPEPPPGVYALHDATDIPALLPDGSPTERSVSAALVQRDLDLGRDSKKSVQDDLAAEAKVSGHEVSGHEIEASRNGGGA